MTTNYARGAAFERRVMRDLEGRSYRVMRSAGSHSPADVVALRKSLPSTVYGYGEVVAVQCKRNGRLDPDEWNEFFEWCLAAGAACVLAMPAKSGRGIEYYELTARKEGRGRQPMVPWEGRQ